MGFEDIPAFAVFKVRTGIGLVDLPCLRQLAINLISITELDFIIHNMITPVVTALACLAGVVFTAFVVEHVGGDVIGFGM
ncbi:hypothetical protein SAMN04488030_1809 [Aliiroseovarius halocynthiae]|nr:hypothetical protein SAMN04488030_1809 [Aliiroseovarius halocynthiae]